MMIKIAEICLLYTLQEITAEEAMNRIIKLMTEAGEG